MKGKTSMKIKKIINKIKKIVLHFYPRKNDGGETKNEYLKRILQLYTNEISQDECILFHKWLLKQDNYTLNDNSPKELYKLWKSKIEDPTRMKIYLIIKAEDLPKGWMYKW